MSNAFSGVIAANSKFPVIACPPFKDKSDIQVDINSSLRCPSGVPVMTVLSVGNAVESCRRILAL
jgi:5-(carboxyamino)imidazole ribonucleotide mutase